MRNKVYVTVGHPSIRLSVPAFGRRTPLLLAWRAENIDQLLLGRRSAAVAPQHDAQQQVEMRAVTLSADIGS